MNRSETNQLVATEVGKGRARSVVLREVCDRELTPAEVSHLSGLYGCKRHVSYWNTKMCEFALSIDDDVRLAATRDDWSAYNANGHQPVQPVQVADLPSEPKDTVDIAGALARFVDHVNNNSTAGFAKMEAQLAAKVAEMAAFAEQKASELAEQNEKRLAEAVANLKPDRFEVVVGDARTFTCTITGVCTATGDTPAEAISKAVAKAKGVDQ